MALFAAAAVTALSYWYITLARGGRGPGTGVAVAVGRDERAGRGAVLLLGWPGARWWRRGLAVLSVPLCVLCATLALNGWVGYFPTVLAAWDQLTSGPLPDQIDRLRVTAMQVAGTKPAKGVVVPVNIDCRRVALPPPPRTGVSAPGVV